MLYYVFYHINIKKDLCRYVAIGRLNSLKTVVTEINTNLELYTSAHNSSNVTINITNQGIESAKVTVGLTGNGLSNVSESDYIILGQDLNPREFISLTNIGIAAGDTLYCRSSKPDISFIAFSVFDYVGASTSFGKQNSLQTNLTDKAINTDLLLLTAEEDSNLTISVNNRSFEPSAFSIGISPAGISSFTTSDYLIFGKTIEQNESFTFSNIVLSATQSIIVRASNTNITFSAFSVPVGISTVSYATTAANGGGGGGGGGNIVGIATTGLTQLFDLDVDGHTELDNLNVSGVSTFVGITTNESTIFATQLSVSGVLTATTIDSASFQSTVSTGTPTIDSTTNLNLNAVTVAISTDLTVGGDAYLGISTSTGLILTSPNGTTYRIIVDNSGTISSVLVP